MATNDTIAAGPEMMDIGGKMYMVAKAGLADFVAIRARMRTKIPTPMQMLDGVMGSAMWQKFPEKLQYETMKEAAFTQLKGELPLTDVMVLELMASDPELVTLLVWTLTRKTMPQVTFEELVPLITNANAPLIAQEILNHSGLLDVEKNSDGLNGSPTRVMEASR